ncbi:MAG: hypothetical protein WAN66_00330, partial [Limnoraphis robusta]|uniref:hypothetical protein n=1 Tax=Limnoraphis robusta TaxID=1118279 RepID=UPI002B1FE319|nr:hypothetical protein [Limnoraphis robusta]MEA5538158.1 hypothetical protein [Limnoraphis robusta Tam1]
MKISKIETIHEQSEVINSPLYIEKRQSVINAIQQIDWPIGTGKFSIYPESGKKRVDILPVVNNGDSQQKTISKYQILIIEQHSLGGLTFHGLLLQ